MQLSLEGVRVSSLVGALGAEEITLGEFSDCLRMLTSEAIQVIAANLDGRLVVAEKPVRRLVAARCVALRIAAERRSLS